MRSKSICLRTKLLILVYMYKITAEKLFNSSQYGLHWLRFFARLSSNNKVEEFLMHRPYQAKMYRYNREKLHVNHFLGVEGLKGSS